MRGERCAGQFPDLDLQCLAVALGRQRQQLPLQQAGMVAGDFRVAFLVPLDVCRQRIPDESEIALCLRAKGPARQHDPGRQSNANLANRASAVVIEIGNVSAELDLGRAGMAVAGIVRDGPVRIEFAIEFFRRVSADAEIGIGLGDDRIGQSGDRGRDSQENGANDAAQPGYRYHTGDRDVELVRSLGHSGRGRNKKAADLAETLTNGSQVTSQRNRTWQLTGGRSLEMGAVGHLMAIVNVTPDSFSDGGRHADTEAAFRHAMTCLAQGATILDIGGESTRPGAAEVTPAEEQARVLPLIEKLAAETDAILSIDTYRAETARLAVEAGAHIINDVHGLQREPSIAEVASRTGAGVCIMHTGRGRDDRLFDVIADQQHFLGQSLRIARDAGIADEAIVLDPGFGFAKNAVHDLELMARLEELAMLGFPILVGTSRKRFVGAVSGREHPSDRDAATAATTAILRMAGAAIFRVHNVAANRDALLMADAVLAARPSAMEKA